jgi:hypothetical protein
VEREQIEVAALESLAVFPLPNAVLLPGALLPLHIFEQRYRDMARDVLDGNHLIAIARLQPGYEPEYDDRPPVFPTAGIGEIIASELLDDGRYYILLRGLARVHIEEELPPRRAYREVRARLVDDGATEQPDEIASRHRQLIAMCDKLSMVLDEGGEQLRSLVRSEKAPGDCADVVTGALVADVEERQRMLETFDAVGRLQQTLEHVGRLLVEIGARSSMPN